MPGVRELFEEHEAEAARRSRRELFQAITPDYYGFRDEEDGILVAAETVVEKELRKQLEREWYEAHPAAAAQTPSTTAATETAEADARAKRFAAMLAGTAAADASVRSHVEVPDEKAIAELIVRKKKELLLRKYASHDLQASQGEAQTLRSSGS